MFGAADFVMSLSPNVFFFGKNLIWELLLIF